MGSKDSDIRRTLTLHPPATLFTPHTTPSHLSARLPAGQQDVHRLGHVDVHAPLFAPQHFHAHVERGRRRTLKHRLLDTSPPRLLVTQSHRLDAANQIRQRWVLDYVFELIAVRSGYQLHTCAWREVRKWVLCPGVASVACAPARL
eukprot:365518-Chlamydomonas_euryale.AAC.2